MQALAISVSIARPPREVYEFVREPTNMRKWAAGLSADAKFRFAERNELGVLDHWVNVAPGAEIYVPMRVVANGEGSEFIFTLFRQPGMSDADLAADAAAVKRDLSALKRLLEL
jgi:hypothetical protein